MKKKIASALSGLALLVSTGSCAGLKTPVLEKIASGYEKCINGGYDSDTRCFEGAVSEMYNSVYQLQREVMLEVKDINFEMTVTTGAATGLLLDGGYVLTAYHVGHESRPELEELGTMRVDVHLKANNKQYSLETVAEDPELDLLLMKAKEDTSGLKHYKGAIGNTSDLELGDAVYLVGNSGGLGINIRPGMVSQMYINPLTPNQKAKLFAISSSGSSGDSGGAVFALRDGRPELVGMLLLVNKGNNISYIAPIVLYAKRLGEMLGDKNPLKR